MSDTQEIRKVLALHWLVVGYVLPGAQAWITEAGGQVVSLHSDPPMIAVAIAFDPAGSWTWSKGRQEYHCGVAFWNTGEVQEASTGITLDYGNADGDSPEFCNVPDNYIILPDEWFNPQTRQIGERPVPVPVDWGDLDDSPY